MGEAARVTFSTIPTVAITSALLTEDRGLQNPHSWVQIPPSSLKILLRDPWEGAPARIRIVRPIRPPLERRDRANRLAGAFSAAFRSETERANPAVASLHTIWSIDAQAKSVGASIALCEVPQKAEFEETKHSDFAGPDFGSLIRAAVHRSADAVT